MKTSKASSYALHALMYMVRHASQLPVTSKVIARSEGISQGYLAKILQRLAHAEIISACRKGNAGYMFTRSPQNINVLEVLETIEENPLFDNCFMQHCDCGGTPQTCTIYRNWLEATKTLKESLAQTSLEDITWKHPEHYFGQQKKKKKPHIIERQSNTSQRIAKIVSCH